MKRDILLLACTMLCTNLIYGQYLLTKAAPTYTQNFNSLSSSTATWTDNSTLAHWYGSRNNVIGTGTSFQILAGNGNINTGGVYSFGTSAADRALGSIASGSTNAMNYGVRLKNNGATPIYSITVSYTGEQWRDGGSSNTNANTFQASYSISANPFADVINTPSGASAYTNVSGWSFNSCSNVTTTGFGGSLICSSTVTAFTLNVTIPAGSEIMIRWTDTDNTGNDDGLAMDDLTITADYNVRWTGATNTTWAIGTNWNSGSAPTSASDVIIPNVTNKPVITSGTASCATLNIATSSSVTTSGSGNLAIAGNLTNAGTMTIAGTGSLQIGGSINNTGTITATSGTVVLNGTDPQTIPANTFSANTIQNLTLNNVDGATLAGTLNITGVYRPTSGVLTTGNYLTLKSSASGTAYIAEGSSAGSYIIGSVKVERYNMAKRCYRSMSHPFSTAIALSQLTDSIDITGPGGAANGFTANVTTSPSAYWFDVSLADTAVTGINTGWVAATSATAADWDPNELLHLFVRGAKGQGLSPASYTALSSRIAVSGLVNQGDQLLTSTPGSNSDFVAYGNPFPSGIQMNALTTNNIGANYYVWDASMGVSGAYRTNQFSTSYVLPAFGAFFTNSAAVGATSITVEESDKVSGGSAVHKTTVSSNLVELLFTDSGTLWDRLLINLDTNASTALDKLDGKKILNPGLDFYTMSADGNKLAVDVRPYADKDSIQVGLTAYQRYNKYAISTDMFNLPANTKLFLYDRYTNKTQELTPNFKYWFDVTADTNTQGKNRFVINVQVTATPPPPPPPVTGVSTLSTDAASLVLVPNPAQNEVKLVFEKQHGTASVKLYNISGKVVWKNTIDARTGNYDLSLVDMPYGMYLVEFQQGDKRFVQKLLKQ